MIHNLVELQAVFSARTKVALDNTMDRLLVKLKEIIMEEVYSYDLNGDWQNRTFEFYESWAVEASKVFGDMVSGAISQEGFNLSYEYGVFSHGNAWSSLDHIKSLDEIIENGLSTSNFGFPAIESRPYWSSFEKWLIEGDNLNKIFAEECVKQGIPIRKASVL